METCAQISAVLCGNIAHMNRIFSQAVTVQPYICISGLELKHNRHLRMFPDAPAFLIRENTGDKNYRILSRNDECVDIEEYQRYVISSASPEGNGYYIAVLTVEKERVNCKKVEDNQLASFTFEIGHILQSLKFYGEYELLFCKYQGKIAYSSMRRK